MDVNIYQTDDGGDITVENGLVEMSGGLASMAYLCLFGGNEDDDGRQDNGRAWWGNANETERVKQYRSETQYLLRSIPATTGNLLRVEDAANRDLSRLKDTGAASSVAARVTMPGLNRVKIAVNIDGDITLEFLANWKAEL